MAMPNRHQFPLLAGFGTMPGVGGFAPTYFMPTMMPHHQQQAPPRYMPQPVAVEKAPVTTVFVGNIHEKCSNDLIRSMLSECGPVLSWKRIQGSNGKFQAFGFCEYDNPEGTMRALRVLHEYLLGDKRLVVKVDDKTRNLVREWAARRRRERGEPVETLTDLEMPADEANSRHDDQTRINVAGLIEQDQPDLLPDEGNREGQIRTTTMQGKGGNLDIDSMDPEKQGYIRDEIERFRQNNKEEDSTTKLPPRRRSRSRSPRKRSSPSRKSGAGKESSRSRKRSASPANSKNPPSSSPATKRRHERSGSVSSASSSSSDSSSSSSSSSSGSRSKKAFRSRSPSRGADSADSEDAREHHLLRKQLRDKQAAYESRLTKWESRERRQARAFDKDDAREKQRKRDINKEAKKLKQFLEDYDDQRDDLKYYKSSSLYQRRRDFERERELDAKDRQKELAEIEELKKQIMAEGVVENADEEALKRHRAMEDALLRKLRADSGSPNPHLPLGQKPIQQDGVKNEEESSSGESGEDGEIAGLLGAAKTGWKPVKKAKKTAAAANGGTPITPSYSASPGGGGSSTQSPAVATTSALGSKSSLNAKLQSVFGEDIDHDDGEYKYERSKIKMKPFEITREERLASMTAEERKKLIKDLIERIPTTRDELFAYPVDWNCVDRQLVERRVKPWVTKKIVDYIGEEEQSLVDFVCEKVNTRTDPHKILLDIAMVLDDEAEVFVVKMWRLLVYESEAKKLGISK